MKVGLAVLLACTAGLAIGLGACGRQDSGDSMRAGSEDPEWGPRLYTPSMIIKHEDSYFLVDTWHHRVLYSSSPDRPIEDWLVFDTGLIAPHSIEYGAGFYLVDDTGHNAIRVYRRKDEPAGLEPIEHPNGDFVLVQIIGPDQLGRWPHRIRYSPDAEAFYVLHAKSLEMAKLVVREHGIEVEYLRYLDFLDDWYTRSFSIIDGSMYIISGPQQLFRVDFLDDSFRVQESWRLPYRLRSMNDLFRTEAWWYLSSSPPFESTLPPSFIRLKQLADIYTGPIWDLYEILEFEAIPYYLTEFDGRLWMTEIDGRSRVISFREGGEAIVDLQTHFDFGAPTPADTLRHFSLWSQRQ